MSNVYELTSKNIDRNKLTPMLKQYMEIKDKHEGIILFYRLGDFYETFMEDAIATSKALCKHSSAIIPSFLRELPCTEALPSRFKK